MSSTQDLLNSSPHEHLFQPQKYYDCIERCFECASACWICADASLNENDPFDLQDCVRLCLSCAEICAATAKAMISQSGDPDDFLIAQLKACRDVCQAAYEECCRHSPQYEHCTICSKCCEECAKKCETYLQELAS